MSKIYFDLIDLQGVISNSYLGAEALASIKAILQTKGIGLLTTYEHVAIGEQVLCKATTAIFSKNMTDKTDMIKVSATEVTRQEALNATLEGLFGITVVNTGAVQSTQQPVQMVQSQPPQPPQQPTLPPNQPPQQPNYYQQQNQAFVQNNNAMPQAQPQAQAYGGAGYQAQAQAQLGNDWRNAGGRQVTQDELSPVFGKSGRKGLGWDQKAFKQMVCDKCGVSKIDFITTGQKDLLVALLEWKLQNYKAGYQVAFSLDYN